MGSLGGVCARGETSELGIKVSNDKELRGVGRMVEDD